MEVLSRERSKRLYYLDDLEIAEGRVPWSYGIVTDRPVPDGGCEIQHMSPEELAAWELAKKDVGVTRLEVSRSPVIDAFIYCALKGWGVDIVTDTSREIRLRVTDFAHTTRCATLICAKSAQTQDLYARLKALQRWFPEIRERLERANGRPFDIIAGGSTERLDRRTARFRALQHVFRRMSTPDLGGEDDTSAQEYA